MKSTRSLNRQRGKLAAGLEEGHCPRCKGGKTILMTDPHYRSGLGDPYMAWKRCQGCGFTFQSGSAGWNEKREKANGLDLQEVWRLGQ